MNKKRKILVVEDEPAVAKGLKDLLEAEDFGVKLASNGMAAITMTSTFSPHLVLLDVHLPKMTGTEVCRQIRKLGYMNTIIMLTAQREQVDKIIGFEAGADDYITKPFDSRELLARVRAHLRVSERKMADGSEQRPRTGKRKLLSIMFTDIKDYSKKMNRNEQVALALLQVHNRIMHKATKRLGGTIIEIIGDAFMISFDSALKAVDCGLVMLQDFSNYNANKGVFEQIHVRIGIHLGDVIEIGDNLRGDTVNIAARLEQAAAPDRMYISKSVYETIQGKVEAKMTKIGIRKLKNIRQPVSIYSLSPH